MQTIVAEDNLLKPKFGVEDLVIMAWENALCMAAKHQLAQSFSKKLAGFWRPNNDNSISIAQNCSTLWPRSVKSAMRSCLNVE